MNRQEVSPVQTDYQRPDTTTPLRRLMRDERGAGLLEYAILAGLIAIAAFMAFKGFGTSVSGVVGKQAQSISTINATP